MNLYDGSIWSELTDKNKEHYINLVKFFVKREPVLIEHLAILRESTVIRGVKRKVNEFFEDIQETTKEKRKKLNKEIEELVLNQRNQDN